MEFKWGVNWYSSIWTCYTDVLMDWEALKKAVSAEVKSEVTHDEFMEMKESKVKAIQDRYKGIKGKAGLIVSGISQYIPDSGKWTCTKGCDDIEIYSVLAFDYDDGIVTGFQNKFQDALKDYEYLAYTTVSSTAESPRWRIIIPVMQDGHGIDCDTRTAMMKMLCENSLGWAGFDESGIRSHQRMCLPVTLAGEETIRVFNTGKMMTPADILPDGWTMADIPLTPKDKNKKAKAKSVKRKALTPIEWTKKDKAGIVGAFLKAYTCSDILDRSGYFEMTSSSEKEQRWSRKGDSMGGIVVYPDDITVCYYASGPLAMLDGPANAFQLYVTLFADGDYKKAFKDAKQDQKVREELSKGLVALKPAGSGDWGNADEYSSTPWKALLERLCEYGNYRFIITNRRGQGYWTKWDGKRYVDVIDSVVSDDLELVLRITCAMNPDMAELYYKYLDDNGKCIRLIKSLAGMAGISHKADEMNADWNLMNFSDGILDVQKYIDLSLEGGDVTQAILPHSPEYLISLMSPVSIREALNPDAEAVQFINDFLEEALPDAESREYLMTGIGSSLGDCSRDNKILIMLGDTGRNGKTTYTDCLKATIGTDYYNTAAADNFKMGAQDPLRANPQLDALRTVRIATFPEASPIITLDVAHLKQFFGSDVNTRSLNVDGGMWRPKFRPIFDLNSVPKLSDPSDSAFRKRLRIISWNVSFAGREKPEIQQRMQEDPKVHAAMMHMLLDGLIRWAKNGYMLDRQNDVPASVKSAINAYYADVDSVGTFIEENIEVTNAADDFVSFDTIYAEYLSTGDVSIAKNSFAKQLRRHMLVVAEDNVNVVEKRATMADNTKRRGYTGIRMLKLSDEELVAKANSLSRDKHWSSYEVNTLRTMVDKEKLRVINVVDNAVEDKAPEKNASAEKAEQQVLHYTIEPIKTKTIDEHRAEWGYTAEEIPF